MERIASATTCGAQAELSAPAFNMATAGDDLKIEVGHCYLVSILQPFEEINKPSPLKVPVLNQGWHTTNALSAMIKVKNKRVHPAVVMRYNDLYKTAVILLGTTRPQPQVHRFIPCYGVKRDDFQTVEILHPTPLEAFSEPQGHFNFSHAIHVRVLQSHEYDRAFLNVPRLDLFKDCKNSEGPLIVKLASDQMALLKTLHTSYWEGKRPTKDGLLTIMVADTSHLLGFSCGEPQDGDPNPILGPSGLKFSTRMAMLLEKEDEKATQMELLDEDEDLTIGPSHLGLFQPLTTTRLTLSSGPLFHLETPHKVEEDDEMV